MTASFCLTQQPTYAAAAASCPLLTQQKPRAAAAAVAGPSPPWQGNPLPQLQQWKRVPARSGKSFFLRSTPPPPPLPVSCGIPQMEGAEETPTTPPERERTPGSETPAEVQPAPPPPPMIRLSRSPYHVLCMRCSQNMHTAQHTLQKLLKMPFVTCAVLDV